MKRFVLILMVMLSLPLWVSAEDGQQPSDFGLVEEYALMYGAELNKGAGGMLREATKELVPGFSMEELVGDVARGDKVFSVSGIINKGTGLLWGEIRNTLKVLIFIPVLAVLCTYLTNIQGSFPNHSTADTAFYVCYLMIAGILAAAFLGVVDCGKGFIQNISVFMRTIVPVLLAAMLASGAVVSVTTFELVLLGIIETVQWLVENVFIPLVMMTAALGTVNNLSETVNVGKLVQFMNKILKWGIGIVMTLFVGVMGLQGIVSGNADMLTVRLTKFATSNLVPMVGGALAETVETVMNCSAVIKNAIGVTGIIAVILVGAVPIIKVAACLIMFRLCAALIQPISDVRITKCISELADTVSCVLGLMAAVTVMFVIVFTIVINTGGY